MESAIAVKSFIVNDFNQLLLIKRRPIDPHSPGVWEIPGGRLNLGEDPFEGLKRETLEETGLAIDVLNPLRVHHFTRDDGQQITMITFFCKPLNNSVVLSEEHTDFGWMPVGESYSKLVDCFHDDLKMFQKYFQ
ncbi:MAG: NUDIX domain-containing protein [archaeon]|nr:NUDIX domain-containing protein [Nanoarchaeota archaeon]